MSCRALMRNLPCITVDFDKSWDSTSFFESPLKLKSIAGVVAATNINICFRTYQKSLPFIVGNMVLSDAVNGGVSGAMHPKMNLPTGVIYGTVVGALVGLGIQDIFIHLSKSNKDYRHLTFGALKIVHALGIVAATYRLVNHTAV